MGRATKRTNGGAVAILDAGEVEAGRGFGLNPTPRRSRATLLTLEDVSRELARLYRRAERGEIATADASRLAYMLATLGKVIEASAIEARLTALEAIADETR